MQIELSLNIVIIVVVVLLAVYYLYTDRSRLIETNERYAKVIDAYLPQDAQNQIKDREEMSSNKSTKRKLNPISVDV